MNPRNVSAGSILVCLLSAGFSWWVGGLACAAERPTPNLEAGQAAYQQSCARCHGFTGKGDGVDAKRFYPRPRDLTLGVYKFRSTVSGTPPADDDLFRTITQGLPGSNMPDWGHLNEATRWQLVYYLKSLSSAFHDATPEPVTVAADPGPKGADLVKGRALYEQLGCASCHGPQGRANGTSAAGLVDDWGMPIRPANLTQGWNYRGWSDSKSVMLRVLTGIDGAGMPSYTGAVSPEDAWQLAYYVTSLQETPHWNRIALAAWVDGPLPESLDDPQWQRAERTDVRVRNAVNGDGEWVAPPTVNAVLVQALHNTEAMALRLTWFDPSEDRQDASDALAVLLKPEGVRGDVVTLQAWPSVGAPPLDLCYWFASGSAAHEMVVGTFEEAAARRGPSAEIHSVAAYADGRWQMVLHRPLSRPQLPGASTLTDGTLTSLAVAVWDGAKPGARAISSWLDLKLQPGREPTRRQTR